MHLGVFSVKTIATYFKINPSSILKPVLSQLLLKTMKLIFQSQASISNGHKKS